MAEGQVDRVTVSAEQLGLHTGYEHPSKQPSRELSKPCLGVLFPRMCLLLPTLRKRLRSPLSCAYTREDAELDAEKVVRRVFPALWSGQLYSVCRRKELIGLENLLPTSCRVEFEGHLDFDLGNLMATDPSPVDSREAGEDREADILSAATRITQSLVAKLFQLPGRLVGMGRVVDLPAPSYPLPRQKPLPTPRPPTRSASLGFTNQTKTS